MSGASGFETTLLAAAAVAATTSLVIAFVPGVRAITDDDIAAPPLRATRVA